MTLGNNIKKIREEAKLSQEDFAEIFCVSRQTISNWENSKSYPDLATIIRISDSFGISLDILLKEDIDMVKTIDKEVKSTKKYARALVVIAVIIALLFGSFTAYSIVYYNTKNNIENDFMEQLNNNNFYKNKDGYYSMNYNDCVVYSVPSQSLPNLLEFNLHNRATILYCDINLEEVKIEMQWNGYNDFIASTISKDNDRIIGSTSGLKENEIKDIKMLSNELSFSEEDLRAIVEKGNELYKVFYLEQ